MWKERNGGEIPPLPAQYASPKTWMSVEEGLIGIAQKNDSVSSSNWHIPRPSLWCAESECSCHTASRTTNQQGRGSTSSQGSSSSNKSTESASSGSLLLTAANLAALRYEPHIKPPDTMSVASSTHFTVVNGITRRKPQSSPQCCCHSHQLTALVITMSVIFFVAILLAVIYLEMRWRDIHLFS